MKHCFMPGDLPDHQSVLMCPFSAAASRNCPDLQTGNLPFVNFFALCETGSIRKPFAMTVANLYVKCFHGKKLSNTDDIYLALDMQPLLVCAILTSLGITQRHPLS